MGDCATDEKRAEKLRAAGIVKKANMVDKGCKHIDYRTPPYVLDLAREYGGGEISLDPATNAENSTKARTFLSLPERDGLAADWVALSGWPKLVFCNPPYGKVLGDWVEKIGREAARGAHIVALLPGQRFETRSYQEHLIGNEARTATVYVGHRLKFIREGEAMKSNPYGSMLYIFNGNYGRAVRVFERLGLVERSGGTSRPSQVLTGKQWGRIAKETTT